MESKLYQMNLKQFLEYRPLKLQLGNFEINEGDIIQLNYFYIHSKSLLLLELIKDSCLSFDSVLLFNMSFSTNTSEVSCQNFLVYNIFNPWEFLLYLKSIYSFIKDSKMRTLIIVDSWNTYLWNEGEREKMLSKSIEKKCWEIIQKLNKTFLSTFIICRKASNISQRTVTSKFGVFNLIDIPKSENVKSLDLLDPKLSNDSSTLYHALFSEDQKKISIFVYPFQWKSNEIYNISI